jgi:hypothetical protein
VGQNQKQKKKMDIVVFDLDDTLINREACVGEKCDHLALYLDSDPIRYVPLHIRPGSREIISWCKSKGWGVVIFSASGNLGVEMATKALFKTTGVIPVAVFNVEHTDIDDEYSKSFAGVKKHLHCLGIDFRSIVAVDDLDCNYKDEPENLILVDPWDVKQDRRDIDCIIKPSLREKIEEIIRSQKKKQNLVATQQ